MAVSKKNSKLIKISNGIIEHPYLLISALFIVTIVVRATLILKASVLPSIVGDELLYTSIASSLFSKGKILFEGQPVSYGYILYPLLIAPLFGLPAQINIFSAIQVFNTICFASAYFPAYKLAYKITGNKKTSLLIITLLAFLPDAIMSKHVMIESVAFPMFMWAFVVAYEAFKRENDIKNWILLGVLGFLLYTLKPLYVCFGGGCVLVAFIYSVKEKSKKQFINCVVLAGSMVILWFLYNLILKYFLLDYEPENLLFYASQPISFISQFVNLIEGMWKYLFFIILEFGIIPVACGINLSFREGKNAKIASVATCSLFFSTICVVYMIYCGELISEAGTPLRIHIRYLFMYFPVLLMFVFDKDNKKINSTVLILISLVVVGLVCGYINDLSQTRYIIDNMMGSAIYYKGRAWDGIKMWKPFYLGLLIPFCTYVFIKGFDKKSRTVFVVFMAVVLLFNQYCGYKRDNYGMNYQDNADAKQVAEIVRGSSAIYVCDDGTKQSIATIAIVTHTRGFVPVIPFRDFVDNAKGYGTIENLITSSTGSGSYTVSSCEIEKPHYIIMDSAVYKKMVGAADIPSLKTDNGKYVVILNEDTPQIIHSALVTNIRNVDDNSYVALYDKELLKNDVIRIQVWACAGNTKDSVLYVSVGDQSKFTAPLTNDYLWYTFEFENTSTDGILKIKLSATSKDVYVNGYYVGGFNH